MLFLVLEVEVLEGEVFRGVAFEVRHGPPPFALVSLLLPPPTLDCLLLHDRCRTGP